MKRQEQPAAVADLSRSKNESDLVVSFIQQQSSNRIDGTTPRTGETHSRPQIANQSRIRSSHAAQAQHRLTLRSIHGPMSHSGHRNDLRHVALKNGQSRGRQQAAQGVLKDTARSLQACCAKNRNKQTQRCLNRVWITETTRPAFSLERAVARAKSLTPRIVA
jgi:hypothetical protein